jgi:uncharacterized protein (DUF1810 family)
MWDHTLPWNENNEPKDKVLQALRAIAKELHVPVLCTMHSHRSLERRKNKRPRLADLKKSEISEDLADQIIFLYRDQYYDPFGNDGAECIIAKSSSKNTGTVELSWDCSTGRFFVMPAINRSPCAPVISHNRRYEHTVSPGASPILVAEDGRDLAEELALYYHQVKRPKPDFTRFIEAQVDTYKAALGEIRNGRKETHWMWFVFPQLRGLGKSSMSQTYGLVDLEEAKAYLADIILGSRLRLITGELLNLGKRNPEEIFGDIDTLKLKSCMTLFAYADENEDSVFRNVLRQYFNGEEDKKTTAILQNN